MSRHRCRRCWTSRHHLRSFTESSSLTKPLESLRGWLVQNNATVMAVLLLVIGVTVIGKGLGSF